MSDRSGITRRDFLRIGGAATAGLLTAGVGGFGSRPAFAQQTPPNVLLIITDQQHIDTISAAGCSQISTPALDALAERGTRFAHSVSANPLCSPARSAIFSGRTSCEAGVHVNGRPIRAEFPNLGQWLSSRGGYDAAYAGKWHLPQGATHFIPGFDVISTGVAGQGNIADTAVSGACAGWLDNRTSADPFLLVASFVQPHDICQWLRLNSRKMDELPISGLENQLPPLPDNFGFDPLEPASVASRREGNEGVSNGWSEEQWRYYLWSYYRHVEMVDAEIGRVLSGLEESGHADDTLVIFTADHGEGTAHHQMTRKNLLYDEALAVPLMVALPGEIAGGRADNAHLASGLDMMPTICDYAGIDAPPKMRGRSLRPVLEQRNTTWREFAVAEVNNNTGRAVRTDRFKYITYAGDPVEQLFDMIEDPGEMNNLADDAVYADTLADHRALLRDWERRLDVPEDVANREAWVG
ncbi:MAG: sulfatase-like hydrolase/transferase [Armatimonadota bacterium]